MNELKVKKSDIGRFVRVYFDDIGAEDGIITDVRGKRVCYLSLSTKKVTDNNGAPIIALGKMVDATNSGLNGRKKT